MRHKIQQLAKDTALYGLSTILGRFLNFILVPFYTNIFPPSDYGIITNLYSYMAIFNIVFIYGMDSSYLKFAALSEYKGDKKVFSTTFISVAVTTVLFSLFLMLFKDSAAEFVGSSEHYSSLITYSVIILGLDALSVLPFLHLRLENRIKKFSVLKIGNILINISLNIILIIGLKQGIEAVLISNAVASLVTLLFLLPEIKSNLVFRKDTALLRRIVTFGLPYLPGGMAAMLLQVINRPIIQLLAGLSVLGVFQASYRLGVFMMLFVMMFQYAWQPFFLQNAEEPDSDKLFAKIFTYFTITGTTILVSLSLFVDDLARLQVMGRSFIGQQYWGGLDIVPIILLAYLFYGFYVNFSAGIYIKEKSTVVPLIMFIGAVVNVASNFTLIPILGMTGAALSTLLSYMVIAVGFFVATRRIFTVPYEYGRLARILAVLLITGSAFYVLKSQGMLNIPIKVILLLFYFTGLVISGAVQKREAGMLIEALTSKLRRRR